jgi:hypothetical protein
MSAFIFQTLLMGWLLVYFYVKLFAAIDTNGELKKQASEGFLGWLDRKLK